MADNYLEKRYDAVLGKKTVTKRVGHTLDELLLKNRSTRGYHKPYIVKREQLEQIVSVNTKIGSGCNRQVLRFRMVTQGEDASKILENIKMGAPSPAPSLKPSSLYALQWKRTNWWTLTWVCRSKQ